jgi:hypothetical protein
VALDEPVVMALAHPKGEVVSGNDGRRLTTTATTQSAWVLVLDGILGAHCQVLSDSATPRGAPTLPGITSSILPFTTEFLV